MKMHRYASLSVMVPLVVLLAVAACNRVIDPYQIFSAHREAVYSDKPALHPNIRLHKAYQVRLQAPDALILGSSKAIQGIPADHDYFAGKRVYNLAAPLASMKELTLLLRHAQAVHPITDVVLALDFLSFNTLARSDGPASGFMPERLLGNEDSQNIHWQDYQSALISADALSASLAVGRTRTAIRHALESGAATSYTEDAEGVLGPIPAIGTHQILTGLGARNDAEIRSRLSDGGHRSNTLKIEEFFTSAVYLPAPLRQFQFATAGEDSLYWYEQFVRELHEHDIRASLVISPSHARLNELIDVAGLWPQWEYWKRSLLAINLKLADEYGQTPYTLFDFSLPGSITTEPFPEAGDSDYRMRYYFESIHFNQHTGALMLDRLMSRTTTESESFGTPLTAQNLEASLREIREKQADFRDLHPDYRIELEAIVAER
ncbi:hypothetical protein [Granulosicoccus antarcticus]|uniref:Uncharacterized protein n=1 Tax=Granulosicoccus antarcticus IMCC3135 TaxID=1192854 RepID=A0A2Z2P0A1_9GAMM|nr:hypothetical protein [Granulosicoccus antarcticus]ASJ75498.1 hypothetical protein IMCC3135_27215 [Granulosicoccus antarcticus IMCC3135]